MATMYDRLGDLLSECLETGEFPEARPVHTTENRGNQHKQKFQPKTIPLKLAEEFATLGFQRTQAMDSGTPAELPSMMEIRATFARLLKEVHPDTANSIASSKFTAERIERLTTAYNKIKGWYQETFPANTTDKGTFQDVPRED